MISYEDQQKNKTMEEYLNHNQPMLMEKRKMEKEKIEEQKIETGNDMEIGVGTKESVALEPKNVLIQQAKIEEVKNKENKRIGDKVNLICKHPDKEEPITISSVKYEKGDQIKASGIWFNKDDEGKIQKGSALAIMLEHLKCSNIKELENKEVGTTLDKGYLCVKAY